MTNRYSTKRYILVGQTPVPEPDLLTWANWLETADRRVAQTDVPGGVVSTVFLGLDHGWGDGSQSPLLFQSICFINGDPYDCERCSTWREAEQQHRDMVKRYSPAVT